MPKLTTQKRHVYIGADPGEKGGFAAVESINGSLIDTLGFGNISETDIRTWLVETLATYNCLAVCLEKVRSSPQMGVTSAFTFGWNYGYLRGLVIGLGLPLYEVTPQEWQKLFGIPKRGKAEKQPDFKKRIRAVAQERFPQPVPDLITLETCDAVFIASWLRLHQLGLLR